MSLEQELDGVVKLNRDAVAQKIESSQGSNDLVATIDMLLDTFILPLIRGHQDAILRLAREIDELKGQRSS